MRRVRKSLVLFLFVVFFCLIVSFLDINTHNISNQKYASRNVLSIFAQMHIEDGKKQSTELATICSIDVQSLNDIPHATQVPSAKGVTTKKIYRLAQLMYAENGSSEDDNCVLLTGIVVVKRMKSEKYPNTLEGVISQAGQYSTYQNGEIECKPDERCLEIAEEILRFDLQKYYPDNLVFQAEFPQGSRTYEQFGHEYFCLE